jgi:hypothetical protein
VPFAQKLCDVRRADAVLHGWGAVTGGSRAS